MISIARYCAKMVYIILFSQLPCKTNNIIPDIEMSHGEEKYSSQVKPFFKINGESFI